MTASKTIAAALGFLILALVNCIDAAEPIVPTPAEGFTAADIELDNRPLFSISAGGDQNLPSSESAAERIARECQTGSLLFSHGDCLAVKAFTGSRFTHVAAVVFIDQQPWVYDSMNGRGVRKMPLSEYLEVQAPDELTLYHPRRKFTAQEADEYQCALERQLGRPYAVSHFLSGRRCDGLHCAEYLTDALISIQWLQAENPVRVSPASLQEGIELHNIFVAGPTVIISHSLEPIPEPGYWCGERWQAAILCVDGCCTQLSRMFLCR
ncbi:YiiX/YebB-like N1pC/P60 family cysteine hydrolase [Planctomicrobium piriforme]|uniref:Permuted papain-like amidase enzyme, YaeF/YiiX, C92 family n=1 Tax=Planctomicrobium piriforme TaxID=1576369 RepID=A0A1I3EK47_9PLAN|nr:YiiX/YebB-like N1pC/P60 family cysteine hydrolase [Planctomicrobium piriforme]SFH99248.1 Permuted papain-like amidase enzyme, YaeF/YiiX, C92 family [Planctomicrobium piriforme]